jgi:N-acetyl sugar amidotransferase
MSDAYQICRRCVMDTTDPDIRFDADGVCSHCIEFDRDQKPRILSGAAGEAALRTHIERIKERGKGGRYDCIIGLSGGIDSSYVAWKVHQLGLRPLAVHVDTGWNSELAVSNIEKIIKKLDIDLFTFVIDWEVMRDLQLAFFRAAVANCDIPQDHAFVAVLYKQAIKHGIKSVISGHNLATEAILPEAWGYTSIDRRHIRAIHSRYGTGSLSTYPSYSLTQYTFTWPYLRGMKIFPILNYGDYRKAEAKAFLMSEFGWRDYGGKHYESRLTKFFQSYYLPKKFGFDKRRAHLASLIVSGQITREAALHELATPPYDPREIAEDKAFIAKKLRVSAQEFDEIIASPPRDHEDYGSDRALIEGLLKFKARLSAALQSRAA